MSCSRSHEEEPTNSGPSSACSNPPADITLTVKFDIHHFVGKTLSDTDRYDILENMFTPTASYKFPQTQYASFKRSFQLSWLSRYPGLVYSPACDGAYCLYCVLFKTDCNRRGLVTEPYRNWKKATEKFDEHFLKSTI